LLGSIYHQLKAGHRYGCLSFEQWSAERKEMHGWSTVC
ncbi:hypothetical protein T4A_6429, partial [Trichinella pseudospiralis]